MTEQERFKLAYKKDDWWAVRDGEITLWKEEVVHLLNELYEENRQLRDNCKNYVWYKAYKRLLNKNKQLEQKNHKIKRTIEELYYTYIYEPSENYDEEALGQITNLLLKEEDVEE